MISVIVPALNEGESIASCLSSLVSQRYDDYELIVVDGGSSDGAVGLAENYADKVIVFKGPVGAAGNFDETNVLSEDVRLSLKIRRFGRIHFNEKMVTLTSTRRIKKYGYPYLVSLYVFNAFLTLLTGRSLRNYPPIRSLQPTIAAQPVRRGREAERK